MMFRVLLLLLLPGAALAVCPQATDRADQRAELHTRLLSAETEAAATEIADQLWRIWTTAPDAESQFLLDRAMERRDAWDFAMAEDLLDDLIDYCPTYPEAFNQRAFVRFLRENYDGALEDIDIVLDADPYHFGALSGKALALMRQGRMELGQKALRNALRVHPFLQERHMLVPLPDDKI